MPEIYNANALHKAEIAASSFNRRIANRLADFVGTMWTAYGFALLACIGLLGVMGVLPALVMLLVAWFSQTFLQLVYLPILSVTSNEMSRKQELQADQMEALMQRVYDDNEAMKTQIARILTLLEK